MSPGFSPVFVASLVHTLPSEFPALIILLEVGGEVELPVGEGTSRDVTVTALLCSGRLFLSKGSALILRPPEEEFVAPPPPLLSVESRSGG